MIEKTSVSKYLILFLKFNVMITTYFILKIHQKIRYSSH